MSKHLPSSQMLLNFRNLYADVFWFGVLFGSSMAFVAIYAARVGASTFEVGLMTAGPAIINLIFSLPAGRWLEGRQLVRSTFWSSIWNRSGYLLIILAPWLSTASQQVWVLILITLGMSIPGTLLAIAFNALFADVVPAEWRAEVVGRRNALLAISTTLTSIGCGLLLDRLVFPVNYQIVFAIGAAGALLSSYHVYLLRPSSQPAERVGQPIRDFARPGLMRFVDSFRTPVGLRYLTRSASKPLLRFDLLRSSFGKLMGAYLFFYIAQYTPIPILPLFMVRDLNLTDGQISLGSAMFYATMLLASTRLSGVTARLGHRRLLVMSSFLYGVYPFLNGLARDAGLYWVASVAGGVIWALTNGGLVNRLMERVPEDDRPAHMAVHNMVLNLGILLGALAGPMLTEQFGLRNTLLISALLRSLSGVVMFLWG